MFLFSHTDSAEINFVHYTCKSKLSAGEQKLRKKNGIAIKVCKKVKKFLTTPLRRVKIILSVYIERNENDESSHGGRIYILLL